MNAKTVKKLKAVISSLLIVIFVIILITGIGLNSAPSGKQARETDWTFLGMEKEMLKDIHVLIGITMSLIVVIHLLLNYKMLKGEIKALSKK